MPFGLCNAPANFQRTVDIVLSGLTWKSCLIYLDDIIIYSKTMDAHVGHLDEVLTLLGTAELSLKLSKCFFSKTRSTTSATSYDQGSWSWR
jgi:Reverse transcriptase (RNA-dependent DNA polymerase)